MNASTDKVGSSIMSRSLLISRVRRIARITTPVAVVLLTVAIIAAALHMTTLLRLIGVLTLVFAFIAIILVDRAARDLARR